MECYVRSISKCGKHDVNIESGLASIKTSDGKNFIENFEYCPQCSPSLKTMMDFKTALNLIKGGGRSYEPSDIIDVEIL